MKNLRPQDIKIGDSVKVKKGMKNHYLEKFDMGGFEGRVFSKNKIESDWFIEVEFDSITIQSMPAKYIRDNINEGVDYACLDFYLHDVVKSKARDTMAQVKAARKAIQKKTGFLSILDEKGKDVWKPVKNLKEVKPKRGELTAPVSKAREREFIRIFNEVQEQKKIAKKEADKLDPNKKIDLEDFLQWVPMPPQVEKAFRGGAGKKKPFRYVEDITKEKFLSIRGLGEKSWYDFLFNLTQNIYFTKYHNTIDRLIKHFEINFEEVLRNLFPGAVIKAPKGKPIPVRPIIRIKVKE